jgi:hypothetical protein
MEELVSPFSIKDERELMFHLLFHLLSGIWLKKGRDGLKDFEILANTMLQPSCALIY